MGCTGTIYNGDHDTQSSCIFSLQAVRLALIEDDEALAVVYSEQKNSTPVGSHDRGLQYSAENVDAVALTMTLTELKAIVMVYVPGCE